MKSCVSQSPLILNMIRVMTKFLLTLLLPPHVNYQPFVSGAAVTIKQNHKVIIFIIQVLNQTKQQMK